MLEIALCDRAGVSWNELQELPAIVVEYYMLDLIARGEIAQLEEMAALLSE